jgi:hypothetical protein
MCQIQIWYTHKLAYALHQIKEETYVICVSYKPYLVPETETEIRQGTCFLVFLEVTT